MGSKIRLTWHTLAPVVLLSILCIAVISIPMLANSHDHDIREAPVGVLLEGISRQARETLEKGQTVPCNTRACVFEDVIVSLPLASPDVMRSGDGIGQGGKAMLNPSALFRRRSSSSKTCVVYGLGISDDSEYESTMADFCEVHAFDCTISPDSAAVVGKSFTFHHVCVGTGSSIGNTSAYGGQSWKLQFKPLPDIMRSLSHKQVDILKFDIEGVEWELLRNILRMKSPPAQMQFELHSKWANPVYVPPETVERKGKPEVNKLFILLHDFGYRVISKELNLGDPACAEFSLVRV